MSTTPTVPTHPADAPNTIQTDLLCIGCGYNLRTLKHTGLCPECARPVRESMFSGAQHIWLRKVKRGIAWMIAGQIGVVIIIMARFAMRYLAAGAAGMLPYQIATCTDTIVGVIWCVAIFLATRSAPNSPVHDRTSTLRPRVRILAVVQLGEQIVCAGYFATINSAFSFYDPNIMYSLYTAKAVLAAAVIVCMAIYLSRLIRCWQPSLVRLAGLWMTLTLISGALTLIMMSVSYYWFVLNKPTTTMPVTVSGNIQLLLSAMHWLLTVLSVAAVGAALLFLIKSRKLLNRVLQGTPQPPMARPA